MVVSNHISKYNETQNIAQAELIEKYGTLVNRIAHHLLMRMPSSVQVDDLIQSGMIGLLEAAKKYDESKGASFETYAGIRIRGAMIDEVRKGDWVPRSVHRNSRMVAQAVKKVEMRVGRDSTDSEIAQELGMDLIEYYAIVQDTMCGHLFSFDGLTPNDDFTEEQIVGTTPNPFDGIQRNNLRAELAKAIQELPEREQLVIALYYDEELNLKEIGEVIGVSESRVSQIHSQAALRLRVKMENWIESESK